MPTQNPYFALFEKVPNLIVFEIILIFLANPLKLLYHSKGALIVYAAINRELKPENSNVNLPHFVGIPEFREFLLCPSAMSTKSKKLI
ncbi:hypothetical protein [Bartonella sp. CL100XZDX]|uniref:hypothetical protein n=1 Tax=Bartonella sp. CL100XZDX TaxID=3243515 RepID=UPI0035CFA58A